MCVSVSSARHQPPLPCMCVCERVYVSVCVFVCSHIKKKPPRPFRGEIEMDCVAQYFIIDINFSEMLLQ